MAYLKFLTWHKKRKNFLIDKFWIWNTCSGFLLYLVLCSSVKALSFHMMICVTHKNPQFSDENAIAALFWISNLLPERPPSNWALPKLRTQRKKEIERAMSHGAGTGEPVPISSVSLPNTGAVPVPPSPVPALSEYYSMPVHLSLRSFLAYWCHCCMYKGTKRHKQSHAE